MPKAVFVPNPRCAEEVMNSGRVLARLEARANAIAGRAQQRAPVDTGAYRDSIHVERDDTSTNRPRFKVIADDFKAAWIEWGTDVLPARRVLGKAAYLKATRR